MSNSSVIVASELVTAFGTGVDCCWNGLMSSQCPISEVDYFQTKHSVCKRAVIIPNLNTNRVMSMIEKVFPDVQGFVDCGYKVFLATTLGEIDILENAVLANDKKAAAYSAPQALLGKCIKLFQANSGTLISAACASSTVALGQASKQIQSGDIPGAVVIGCDSVSEFVFSGFSGLGALSETTARPFDTNRDGLILGEAAGIIVMTSSEVADKNNMPTLGKIIGFGMSCDAFHATAPDSSGNALSEAISTAVKSAGLEYEAIGGIVGHGTGTIYNDQMEINALRRTFSSPKPLFSTKHGTGHTLAAAGIVQAAIALVALKNNMIPPQGGLNDPIVEAAEWVSSSAQKLQSPVILSHNIGFGGINAAIVIK